MADHPGVQAPDQRFWNRLLLSRRIPTVEHRFEIGVSDLPYQARGFLDGIDEVGIRAGKGLDAVNHLPFTGRLQAASKSLLGPLPGLIKLPPLLDCPLVRGAMC